MELKIMGLDVGLAVLTMANGGIQMTPHPQTLQRPLVFVTWQFVLLLNDTETLQQPENMKRSARKLAGFQVGLFFCSCINTDVAVRPERRHLSCLSV